MDIENIRARIAQLPKGTVVYKTIRGKQQPYLQWYESGKTRSRYLKAAERDQIVAEVAQRRELEAQLAGLTSTQTAPVTANTGFEMHVVVGEALQRMTTMVAGLRRRDCFCALERHLGRNDPRVCVLYGLRRTGKTTLLLQAAGSLDVENLERAAYIKARPRDDMAALNRDVLRLSALGYRYLFIDEVTLLSDFIDGAALLSDIFAAQGMRIVLAGTDSLGFWLAAGDELYDRALMLHTTFIPFAEHARLLGVADVDDYIRYGGTLREGELDFNDPALVSGELAFADDESTRRYIDTAICRNIQHSLACYQDGSHFHHLQELYRRGELTNAVNRIIEDMNHDFVAEVVLRSFKSHDHGVAARNLRSSTDPARRTNALDFADRERITRRLMELLDIRPAHELGCAVGNEAVAEIKEYLRALDLIATCRVEHVLGGPARERVVFTQPGMRFCQAQALVHALAQDEYLQGLSQAERDTVSNAVLDDVRGRMLEDIVLFETSSALGKRGGKRAFKLLFAAGEFDMVIYDERAACCSVFEIKHSTQSSERQARHLLDPEKCRLCERVYGPIVEKTVIYRGPSVDDASGVRYLNASDYLCGLRNPGDSAAR